jgi:branched-chain amino acid transport system substrate-binding protein
MRPQVLDCPVELKAADTRSQRAEEISAVFRLIEKEHATAVIGGVGSGDSTAASAYAESRGIPLIGLTATGNISANGNGRGLRVWSHYEDQADQAAHLALASLGAETAAIIYDMSDEHSLGLAAGFERAFTGNGGKILLKSRIKTRDRDFMGQIHRIRITKPDMIYAPLNHLECALFAGQVRNTGMGVPIIAGDAVHVEELMEFGGSSVENLIFTTYFSESMVNTDAGGIFRGLCTKRTGSRLQAAHVMGADAYFLILDAIERAGSADPKKIREALSSLGGFEGVTGRIAITDRGKVTRPVYVTQVKDGRFVEWEAGSKADQKFAAPGRVERISNGNE